MKIVLIGTGNVATVLGKKLYAAGHDIVQVYGRNHVAAAALANQLGTNTCLDWNEIDQTADLYLIAVSDKALADNTIGLRLQNQLVVHTAGAVSMNVLQNISASYGVFYPFQTIRKEVQPSPEIPIFVDANTTAAKKQLVALGNTISSSVMTAGDEERMQYHLCAVMINNFSNFLYVLAMDYCSKHGMDFTLLLPLIDETAGRLHRFAPRHVQTGPAVRKDLSSIHHHLAMLDGEPVMQKLYKIITESMLEYPWQISDV